MGDTTAIDVPSLLPRCYPTTNAQNVGKGSSQPFWSQ